MGTRAYAILSATLFSILLLLFLHSIAEIVLLLFIAILIAIYLSSLTDLLQRKVGMPRGAGLAAALLVTGMAVAGIGQLVVPPLVDQTQQLLASLPGMAQKLNNELVRWAQHTAIGRLIMPPEPGSSILSQVVGQIGGWFRSAVPVVFGGVQVAIELVSVFVMGITSPCGPACTAKVSLC